ncbi:DUF6414 family protein [Niallia taxi]|uniref:DUF6414 family protein n=1 Tax=Niallia taxi TaxID=2499688 RepID=UPI003F6216C4
MKEIIYLDTGLLHSYIAQLNDGLPTGTNNERSEEVRDSSEKEAGNKSRSFVDVGLTSGEFKIPGLFKSPGAQGSVRIQPGRYSGEKISLSQLESAKEIISKQLHDNALEILEEHLNKEKLFVEVSDSHSEGKFIKITTRFKIIDFKNLSNIMQTEKLMELMFLKTEQEVQLVEEQYKQANSQTKALLKTKFQQAKSALETTKKNMRENISIAEKTLEYLGGILPTEAFLKMDNTISPLKQEFLREKSQQLMFKYGHNGSSIDVTLVGKVTSKVKSVEMPNFNSNSSNVFLEFPAIITFFLNTFGVVKRGDLIVTPIAIYFE